MTDSLIREIEALRVGPDEILIVRASLDTTDDECEVIANELDLVGLSDRSLLFRGDVEFVVVKNPSTEGAT